MIDCHFHLLESLTPIDRLIESMDRHGIKKTALIGELCEDLESTLLTRTAAPLFRKGVTSRFAVFRKIMLAMYSSWVKKGGQVDVGGKMYDVVPQPDNDAVMAAVAARPDRFAGWIFVNPAGPVDACKEIERCWDAPGMIGVKAHTFWHAYPTALLIDAAALCAEKKMPMLIHIGAGLHGDFRVLPEKFPNLNVIYAHAGVPYQKEICKYAGEKPNVFVDLSGDAYVDAKITRMAVDLAGADKCLFGTDGPYFHHEGGYFDFGPQLDLFNSLGLGPGDAKKIGGANFEDLIG